MPLNNVKEMGAVFVRSVLFWLMWILAPELNMMHCIPSHSLPGRARIFAREIAGCSDQVAFILLFPGMTFRIRRKTIMADVAAIEHYEPRHGKGGGIPVLFPLSWFCCLGNVKLGLLSFYRFCLIRAFYCRKPSDSLGVIQTLSKAPGQF